MNEPVYQSLTEAEQTLVAELLRKFIVHAWADTPEEDDTAQLPRYTNVGDEQIEPTLNPYAEYGPTTATRYQFG